MLFGISFAIHPKLEMKMKIRMKTNFRMTKKFSYGWRLPFFHVKLNEDSIESWAYIFAVCKPAAFRAASLCVECLQFFEKMKFSISFRSIHRFIHYSNLIQSFINLTHQHKQNVIRFQVWLLILGFEECRLSALSSVIQLFKCKQTTNDAV